MNRITEAHKKISEQYIDEVMKAYDAQGLAACIIDSTGETQYELYRGYRDSQQEKEIDGDTIFGLASVTKSFVAMSVLQMQEAGILHVCDPIQKYLPEFTVSKEITIEHFLTHSAGFYPQPRTNLSVIAEQLGLTEERDGEFARHSGIAEKATGVIAGQLNSAAKEGGLFAKPGEYFSYCNDGFGLLSEIVRRYGGYGSFAEYVQEKILLPLGMERSFCDYIRPALDDNASILYQKIDGKVCGDRNYYDNAFALSGAGAMKSTLNDLKKYLALYLNKGKEDIISAKSIESMIRPHIPFEWHSNYGYGLYSEMIGDMVVTGHGGSLPGVSSNISFTYDNDCAVIVLCNTSGVPVSQISAVLMRMYAGLGTLPVRSFSETGWPDLLKETVIGEYGSAEEGENFTIRKNDKSHLLLNDGEEHPLVMVSTYEALVCRKYGETYVRPIMNEEGNVIAAQYGSRVFAKKG